MDQVNTKNPEQKKFPKIFIGVLSLITLLAIGAAVYFGIEFYMTKSQNSKLNSELTTLQQDPAIRLKEENDQIVAAVGKLINLPTDEQPTIATVTDLSKLQNQPFFQSAQLGDKVLIYQNAKKAILYRPSENKIIEVAPLDI
jgi:hypothetical protein